MLINWNIQKFTSEKSSNSKTLTWSTNLELGPRGWDIPSIRSVLQL